MRLGSLTGLILIFLSAACADRFSAPLERLVEPDVAFTGTWHHVGEKTGSITGAHELAALGETFPDSASVQLRLLSAQLQEGDTQSAFKSILRLTQRGYAFSEPARDQILAMYEGQERTKLAGLSESTRASLEQSKTFAIIPKRARLVESIAYDPSSDTLFATTVVSGKLYARTRDEKWTAIDIPDAAALSGIGYDKNTGYVWLASGDPGLGSESRPGFRGLIAYNVTAGRVVRRIAAPGSSNPSDLVIASDGRIYVSDPLSGVIYTARSDDDALDVFVPSGIFRSPQGMAESSNGRFLYVSDYRYGLAVIEKTAGRIDRLRAETPVFLDGIDGMWRWRDQLIAIQNGSRPMRILRIQLGEDGRSIAAVRALEFAHSEWTEPLGGTIIGDRLLYVGNGQWDRFIEGGADDPDNPPEPTEIRVLPLREGAAHPVD